MSRENSPLVSIIIPTYNRKDFIIESVESVLNQTFRDYEIIVVDDGSTDGTERVLQPYRNLIKYIYQENKGPAEARNLGIKYSLGKYIAFNDSDDLWVPKSLELRFNFLRDSHELGLVFSDMCLFDEKGIYKESFLSFHKHFRTIPKIVNTDNRVIFRLNVFDDLLEESFISIPTVIIRRDCFNLVGLFRGRAYISSQEDREMWLRVSRKYKIGYVNEVLAQCRTHGGNFRVNTEFIINSRIQLFNRVIHEYERISIKSINIARKQLSIEHFDLGYYFFHQPNIKLARASFISSWRYSIYNFSSALYYLLTFLNPKIIKKIKRILGGWGDLNS